jgi:Na+-driven multidrug efflux pump
VRRDRGNAGDAAASAAARTPKSIFRFWAPLAATWLMMAVEGPFLAAVIARLADPEFNLAAYGVAFAFAMLAEAPVIMLMSAATALVDDATSLRRLRAFMFALIAAVTCALATLLVPAIYRAVMLDLLALPEEVARRTYVALWILLPWPAAIGYRRFYQGLLIRDGRPRLVAWGTVFRLTAMAGTALALHAAITPPGALVGAAALAAGVCAEAAASRWMARGTVRRLARTPASADAGAAPLGFRAITRFYYPLALTSIIGLAVQPLLTFFMGRAPAPVESLAVFPVVHALGFFFRALGLSYQEVVIALMGRRHEHARELGRFAFRLGLASSAALALVALTPLAGLWYHGLSGLDPELARYALRPTLILIPIPFLTVLLSFQRGILVVSQTTRPLTWATVVEVGGIALLFPLLGWKLGVIGVTAAVSAFLVGRAAGNLYLIAPCLQALRGPRRLPPVAVPATAVDPARAR